jgi:hypothetical protein
MFNFRNIGAFLLSAVVINYFVGLKSVKNNNDSNDPMSREGVRITNRSPSSIVQPDGSATSVGNSANEGVKVSSRDKSNFSNMAVSNNGSDNNSDSNSGAVTTTSTGSTRIGGSAANNPTSSTSSGKNSSASSTNGSNGSSSGSGNNILNTKSIPTSPGAVAKNIFSPAGGNQNDASNSTPTNSCNPNIVGGTFNNPIGITITCDYTSTVKYCIGVDSGSGCCDPYATGTDYTTQVIVGPTSGNYCLSYYGESAIAGTTMTYQNNYTINSTFPNLQVGNTLTYYQTTQLSGTSYISSNDFGKTGFGIGQVNLKTHDPSVTAENLSCEEIITNYVALPAPTAVPTLSYFDVSGFSTSQQVEIPLRLDELDYGENFVTSYISNTNYVTPIYSCATTKITLNDFEYFESELAFGDNGTNTVREFTGGFSTYGFFEPETTVFRGPAGESNSTQGTQKLENGLFGIFF